MERIPLVVIAVIFMLMLIVVFIQARRLRRLGDLHRIKMPWDVGTGVVEVRMYWPDNAGVALNVVPATELAMFLAATERLHIHPGINPYSHGQCKRPVKITIRKMYGGYRCWWSSPDLSDNNGARVFHWCEEEVVWEDKLPTTATA